MLDTKKIVEWELLKDIKNKEIVKDPKDFVYFVEFPLTAAFENFVVLKAKEKGINLSKDNIDSINDKQAFPNWEQTAKEYFDDFVNKLVSRQLVIHDSTGERAVNDYINVLSKLSESEKELILKLILLRLKNIDYFYREVVVPLKELKNEVKQ